MRYWKTLLIIFLTVYALPVLGYIIYGTLGEHGANDFHQFWYAGQFILLGQDPYQAFFSGLSLPMRQPGLEITPSNSPPMLLVLTLFSLLPWMTAKLVWLAVNLILVFVCFYLVEHSLPFPDVVLERSTRLLILLIFFDLSPTRIAVENGQTTLFVFALMLLSILLAERSWLFAGILFGLALSKYSVSLPVAIFFLYHRNFRLLITAGLVQLLGFAALSLLSGNSIVLVFLEYFRLFVQLMNQPGIHLASLIPGTDFDGIVPIAMLLALAYFFYFWLIRGKAYQHVNAQVLNFHLLSSLSLWVLLVAYHRLYDAVLILFLIILFFKSNYNQGIWNISARMRNVLAWGLAIGLSVLIIPARIVDMALPDLYDPLTNEIPAVILLIFLLALMFLFRRFLSQPVSRKP